MECTVAISHPQRAMRVKDVARYLGIGQSTVWRWVKLGKLPKGRQLSPRVTVWIQYQLDAFLEQAAANETPNALQSRECPSEQEGVNE